MCEVSGLRATNYYRWKQYQRIREEKPETELSLVRLMEGGFMESDKTYGYRTIEKALEQKGKAGGKYYRNLIQQNFKAERKN